MVWPILYKYNLVPRGGPGLSCDPEGLALGPVTLATRVSGTAGNRSYQLVPIEDMKQVLRLAYGPVPDAVAERCCRGLVRVTQLLETGEDALAGIRAVLIGFPEITPDRMTKLANATSLRKYNPDWGDEPRIPAGNPDGGQWTTSGGDEAPPHTPDEAPARVPDDAAIRSRDDAAVRLLVDVAYQGRYHDQVVAEVAAYWRAAGHIALTAVDLVGRNGATARADIIAIDSISGKLVIIEVKTGDDPQYTAGQQIVYPLAQIGDHVYSPNAKIAQLGFSPGQWLPPMVFVTIYKRDAGSSYEWVKHPSPIVP